MLGFPKAAGSGAFGISDKALEFLFAKEMQIPFLHSDIETINSPCEYVLALAVNGEAFSLVMLVTR